MDKTDAEWIWNQMGLLLSYHRARGQRLIAPAGGNPDVRLCARSAPLDGGSIFGFLGGTSWLEADPASTNLTHRFYRAFSFP